MHGAKEQDFRNYAEEAVKREAAKLNQGACGELHGMALDEPQRASLRERVETDLRRVGREVRRAGQLAELQELLDKHPDIARILDLVELVRR